MSVGILNARQLTRLPLERSTFRTAVRCQRSLSLGGFTLAELLVSVGVLVLIVLLTTQLLNSTATITTLGQKQMDADSQARQLLDRMVIDFAHMVKRRDADYFAKGTAVPNSVGGTMSGNDQIAFYSTVPGYLSSGSPSSVSLVAYRVNPRNKLERLGKGLLWNGVNPAPAPTPVVFLPFTIAQSWPAATNGNADPDYEVIGSQVFRFEYYYLLTNGSFSDVPWDTTVIPSHTAVNGMQDVAAIVVDIAVIDPKSKVLVSDAQLATLNGASGQPAVLVDYSAGITPGQLLASWRAALDANTLGLPRPAISGIRLYERYFYF